MPFFVSKPMSRALDRPSRLILGLGLGGIAAAWGAVAYYRARIRPGGFAAPGNDLSRATTAPKPASQDWIAGGQSMDTLVPSAYSVPDPFMALDPDTALDPAADSPPVTSVFPDPEPTADSPAEPEVASSGASISNLRPIPEPEPDREPWMGALGRVMEKRPSKFGYSQSEWTAPLLGRYLQEIQGVAVPIPRLRAALKELGYRWERIRYVHAGSGKGSMP